MSRWVVDSSAVLALRNREPGVERVEQAVAQGAAISAVNLAEVVAKMSEAGSSEAMIHEMLDPLELEVIGFDADLAYRTGLLRPLTRRAGLSLGDRACLALARRMGLPVLTADRVWVDLGLGVEVRLIR